LRERSPTTDFVILKAECLSQAVELLRLRLERLGTGSLSGNLPARDPDFVGRDQLFRRLQGWIDTTAVGYLVLAGGAGAGKPASRADSTHRRIERGEIPIRHFIDYHPNATGRPDRIAESLYQQLRVKYAVLEPRDWPGLPAGDRLELLLREHV